MKAVEKKARRRAAPKDGSGGRSPARDGWKPVEAAFGRPRDRLGHRFVYSAVSQRARGLSISVNPSRDKRCGFVCVLGEGDRAPRGGGGGVDGAVGGGGVGGLLLRRHGGRRG